jgi:hypothetical protein
MKLGFSYKFLFFLLLIVILAYISLEYFNVIEGNRGKHNYHSSHPQPLLSQFHKYISATLPNNISASLASTPVGSEPKTKPEA